MVYVDDIVIFGKTNKRIHEVVRLLEKHFDLKTLGKTRKLLGVEFEENSNLLSIHQLNYIEDVCNRFKEYLPPISSLPIAKGIVFSKSQSPKSQQEIDEMHKYPYSNLLGCLAFLANRTRPDISYAVNIFSQFQSNPGMFHWSGLLKLLGYIIYTKNLKLNLKCNSGKIIAYSDADFAANRDDRTSMGGQFILLDSSPIMWRTFKHKCVSLSTMEAEFISMTETVKEVLWYDRILDECISKNILNNHKLKSLLYVDNMASMDFIKSPIENHRSKHIDVKLFFVRDLYYKEVFILKYINSKNNLADPFTKPLTKSDLNKFKSCIFST